MDCITCVLCLDKCSSEEHERFNDGTETVGYKETHSASDETKNQKVLFLLRKVLQIPVEIYCSFESLGDPASWINCCDSCYVLLEDSKTVFDHMTLLQQRYDKLQNEMRNIIVQSVKSERNVDNDPKRGVKYAVRSYFKNKLDSSFKEVKTEVCLDSDCDEVDPHSNSIDEIQKRMSSENGSNEMIEDPSTVPEIFVNDSIPDEDVRSEFPKCGNVFMKRGLLMRQVGTHEGHQCESFKCDTCGKPFALSRSLLLNKKVQQKAATVEITLKCKICGEIFALTQILQAHMDTHRIENTKETKRNPKKSTKGPEISPKEVRTELVSDSNLYLNTHTAEKAKAPNPKPKKSRKAVGPKIFPEELRTDSNVGGDGLPNNGGKKQMSKRLNHSQEKLKKLATSSPKEKTEERFSSSDNSGVDHIQLRNQGESDGNVRRENSSKNKCERCGKSFLSQSVLRDHMNMHTGERPYKCHLCGKSFGWNSVFGKHIKTHSKLKPYKCESCGSFFKTFANLKKHSRLKSHDHGYTHPVVQKKKKTVLPKKRKKKMYECKTCGRSFKFRSSIKDHMNVHTGARPYKCDECGKTYTWYSTYRDHKITHTSEKRYKCQHCDKCLSSRWALKIHIRSHTGEKPHVCEHCGKSFSDIQPLRRHLVTHTGEKPYKCQFCGKCFGWLAGLKFHMESHITDSEKTLQCDICGKSFKSRAAFSPHYYQHTYKNLNKKRCDTQDSVHPRRMQAGEKPTEQNVKKLNPNLKIKRKRKVFRKLNILKYLLKYKRDSTNNLCGICGKVFLRAESLKIHLRTHSEEQIPDYECRTCRKCFVSQKALKWHWQSQPDLITFVCDECGKGFAFQCTLQRHLKTHNEDKKNCPFDDCGQSVSRKNWATHSRLHSGQKPLVCDVCGKIFLANGNLKDHLKTHDDSSTIFKA